MTGRLFAVALALAIMLSPAWGKEPTALHYDFGNIYVGKCEVAQ